MKKINIFLFMLFSLLVMSSCEKDETMIHALSSADATPPSLSFEGTTDVVVTEDNYGLYHSVLNWSKAEFGKDILVEYILQIDDSDTFDNPLEISLGGNVYSKSLSGEDLSGWAIKYFGGYDEETNEVKQVFMNMRIAATLLLENSSVTYHPDSVFSNSISMSVTPLVKEPAFPENIYMIGADFGNWDWSSNGIVELVPVNGLEGTFWGINYFTKGNGFKWSPNKDWGKDFFQLDKVEGYTTADGNAFVANDGMYVVYIDMPNGVITIEEATVYGMGDCFGGWNEGQYPFTINGDKMSATTVNAGELRMYAGFSKASTDWWTREFMIFNGKIAYRGNGGDQDRVNVKAGQTVVLDFKAGTGAIN